MHKHNFLLWLTDPSFDPNVMGFGRVQLMQAMVRKGRLDFDLIVVTV